MGCPNQTTPSFFDWLVSVTAWLIVLALVVAWLA
jgi:hypothetical protein